MGLTGGKFITIMRSMRPFITTQKSIVIYLVRIFFLLLLCWYLFCLYVPPGSGKIVYDCSFPPGSGIKKLAAELKSAGIIRSSWHFILVARLRGESRRLKAGDYRLTDAMDPEAILHKIVTGDVDYRRFVLPEGYSIFQAADLLEQNGYFPKDEFLEKCRDKALLDRLGIHAGSVEGYLYPATYNLQRNETPEQLIEEMVGQFNKVYGKLEGEAGKIGLSRSEIITLASIIEKEAVSPDEKPLIASVFYNRLKLGMPLQSDPTAVYSVRAFAGKVTKADIERHTPYNTYVIPRLPPGPIGNPGADSIRAAIFPAQTDYLYFVARKDGTHQFSASIDEHNRAVAKYLK